MACIRQKITTWTCVALLAAGSIALPGCGKENAVSEAGSSGSKPSTGMADKKADQPKVSIDCEKVKAANKAVGLVCSQISFMTDDASFTAAQTGKNEATGLINALGVINMQEFREHLELIAKLPDNTDNEFNPLVSKSLPAIKEMIDLYEQGVKSGKPFSDGSGLGEKMKKLATEKSLDLAVAIGESLKKCDCK